jgi:hypothetical protein
MRLRVVTAAVAVLGLVATLSTFSPVASATSNASSTSSTPTSSTPAAQSYRVEGAIIIHSVRGAELKVLSREGDYNQCISDASLDGRSLPTGIVRSPVWMETSNNVLCLGRYSWEGWQVEVTANGVTAKGFVLLKQISMPLIGPSEYELTCDGGFVNATCQNSSQRTVEFNMTLPSQDPTLSCVRTIKGKVGFPLRDRQFCTYGGYPVPTPAIYGTLWKVDNVDRCYDAGDKCFPAGLRWAPTEDQSSETGESLTAYGAPSAAGQYGVWIVLKDQPHAKDQFVEFDIVPAD